MDGGLVGMRKFLLEELIPLASEGLQHLGIAAAERTKYLTIIRQRVESRQNGAAWQRAFVARHGRDFVKLTAAYLSHQLGGKPVHEWDV